MGRLWILVLSIGMMLGLQGCSALNTQLEPADDFYIEEITYQRDASGNKVKDANGNFIEERKLTSCDTADLGYALKCARKSREEFVKLKRDLGGYKSGNALTALGLGTTTAGVIAYDGGVGVLKGLAITTGGLLGLNGIAKPDEKVVVLDEGIKQMSCAIRATISIQGMTDKIVSGLQSRYGVSITKAELTTLSNHQEKDMSIMSAGVSSNTVQGYQEFESAAYYKSLRENFQRSMSLLNQASSESGQQLTDITFEVRNNVQTKLYKLIPLPTQTSMKNDRDAITDMLGEIVRKRGELKEQLKKMEDSQGAKQSDIAAMANTFVEETTSLSTQLRQCVGESAERALGGS